MEIAFLSGIPLSRAVQILIGIVFWLILGYVCTAGAAKTTNSLTGDADVYFIELYDSDGNQVSVCSISCEGLSGSRLEGCEIDSCY